jgi:hypothetical protein
MLHCLAFLGSLLPVAASVGWVPLLAESGQTYGLSWALILLCVVLGLIVTLKSSHRTSEVKKAREY